MRATPKSAERRRADARNGKASVDLHSLTAACLSQFRRITESLHRSPETTSFATLDDDWRRYYVDTFGPLDRALLAHAKTGAHEVGTFIPVSISHHNLHRLMEVLRPDMESALLSEAPIPERITDLLETCRRLESLLANTAGATAE